VSDSRRDLLRWQFDFTWSLFEYHLERLEPADFLWEPAALCWTVRPGADGAWVPDWADTETRSGSRAHHRRGCIGMTACDGSRRSL
jgi:hypothetical protein